ncbi:hypothetical protein D3C84_254090 [compost metagenome]
MLHITMIGCGAIGVGVLELLESDPHLCVDAVIVPEDSQALVHQRLASLRKPGPFLLEVDMLSIGSFKTIFAGPPTNEAKAAKATV